MAVPLERKSFLLVDDFGDIRAVLRAMLHSFGVTRIEMAANGKDAVAAMEKNKFDVILCDYNLGVGKDGQQVLEEARHRRLISLGTVFVMITAENTREMVMGAIEYEPDSYLSKPFTKDLLRSRLDKLLVQKQDLEAVDQALERNDFPRAIRVLDERLAARPKNFAELTRLKADLCYRSGAYDAAAEIYEKILAMRDIPWAKLGLGKVMFGQGRLQDARRLFQDLTQEQGHMSAAYDWLARTHQALGDLKTAQEVLSRAVQLSPKAILRQQALGDLALRNQDFKTAEQAFTRAVYIGRHSVYRHPSQYAKLVESKVSNPDTKDKLAVMTLVKQMEREFPRDEEAQLYTLMTEARVQQSLGNVESARQGLAKAAELHQRLGGGADAGASLALAKVAAQLGDKDRAQELIVKLVRNNHENDALLDEIQATCHDAGIMEASSQMIQDIRKEIVELNNRGVQLASAGQIDAAIGIFEEAADGMPGNRTINLNAAKVLVMFMERHGVDGDSLGRTRKYLERIRRLAPNDTGLARVIVKLKQVLHET